MIEWILHKAINTVEPISITKAASASVYITAVRPPGNDMVQHTQWLHRAEIYAVNRLPNDSTHLLPVIVKTTVIRSNPSIDGYKLHPRDCWMNMAPEYKSVDILAKMYNKMHSTWKYNYKNINAGLLNIVIMIHIIYHAEEVWYQWGRQIVLVGIFK